MLNRTNYNLIFSILVGYWYELQCCSTIKVTTLFQTHDLEFDTGFFYCIKDIEIHIIRKILILNPFYFGNVQ